MKYHLRILHENDPRLLSYVRDMKALGTVAFTNGCFDVLHPGHLQSLKDASMMANSLIVGLNSDASVKANKGESRPIICQQHRAEILEGLSCVDLVVIFDSETPLELIKKIMPDVLVKGEDYKGKKVVGEEFAGKVHFSKMREGYSTTSIIEKIKNGT